jgi:hypothetical protein
MISPFAKERLISSSLVIYNNIYYIISEYLDTAFIGAGILTASYLYAAYTFLKKSLDSRVPKK